MKFVFQVLINVICLAFVSCGLPVMAAESEYVASSLQAPELNDRMQAVFGSSDLWSGRFDLTYEGGSLERPLSNERPNFRGDNEKYSDVNLSGILGVKYQFHPKRYLFLGGGFRIARPFHETFQAAFDGNQNFDIYDPYLEYGQVDSFWGQTHYWTLAYVYESTSFARNKLGMVGKAIADDTLNFGPYWGDQWNFELYLYSEYNFYKDENFVSVNNDNSRRTEVMLAPYPSINYSLNSKWTLRTLFGWFEFKKYRGDVNFNQVEPYQTFGVGYAYTKFTYIYPYIQLTPKNVRADRTVTAINIKFSL